MNLNTASLPFQQSTQRGRFGRCLGVQVAATGSYVPEEIVTNQDLASLGYDSDWIVKRTGILQRRRAGSHEATSDLAVAAARQCLANASLSPSDLDLILVATMTPDHPTPSAACQVQRRLGAKAPALDLNAACAGFMYGLITGAQFVVNGNAARVLVIGADIMTRTVDPLDVKTYPLFGDGAGAALLVPNADRSAGILGYSLGAEGDGGELLCIPAGGSRKTLCPQAWEARQQYLKMDGRAVFKWAVRIIEDTTKEVLEGVGINAADLNLVIFHQANQRIIEAAMGHLPVRREQIFANLEKYGNTSAASIPLAVDEALAAGRIHSGDHVLLCGFGAGLAWGTAVIRW